MFPDLFEESGLHGVGEDVPSHFSPIFSLPYPSPTGDPPDGTTGSGIRRSVVSETLTGGVTPNLWDKIQQCLESRKGPPPSGRKGPSTPVPRYDTPHCGSLRSEVRPIDFTGRRRRPTSPTTDPRTVDPVLVWDRDREDDTLKPFSEVERPGIKGDTCPGRTGPLPLYSLACPRATSHGPLVPPAVVGSQSFPSWAGSEGEGPHPGTGDVGVPRVTYELRSGPGGSVRTPRRDPSVPPVSHRHTQDDLGPTPSTKPGRMVKVHPVDDPVTHPQRRLWFLEGHLPPTTEPGHPLPEQPWVVWKTGDRVSAVEDHVSDILDYVGEGHTDHPPFFPRVLTCE